MPSPPRPRRPTTLRVVVGVSGVALGVLSMVVASGPTPVALTVLAVAIAVVSGEALQMRLPYPGGVAVRLAPSDGAVLAACVLTTPVEVALGSFLGVLAWQVAERLPSRKIAFNVAQYTLAATAAAHVYRALAPAGAAFTPADLPVYALAGVVFAAVGTALVGLIMTTVTGQPLTGTVLRLLPAASVMLAGGACLGLLAVGLIETHAYLVPTLAVPMIFVRVASRQQVEARLRQERAGALVTFERRLAGALRPAQVDAVLLQGITEAVGAHAAIRRDGTWVTAPGGEPPPTPDPPIDPHCVVATRDAIVVAWGGELALDDGAAEWVERLVHSADERSARARTELELEHERATLRRVVDGTEDGIYVLDRGRRVVECNPAMARLLGTTAAAVVGRSAADVLGAGPWASTGVHDVTREADDPVVWRVAVAPIDGRGPDRRDPDEIHVGVVHDVTEERRLSRIKDDMLAVVSHELRTPLTPIRAAASMLASRWDRMEPGLRGELLEQVTERADHLTRLVDDLLLVARMSNGQALPDAQWEDADLAALVHTAAAHHDATRTHDVAWSGPASLPVVTDARRIRQVVDKLVDNACKFSAPGSTVTVDLSTDGGTAVLTVRDAGCGIPASHLERVFERFERVEDPLVMRTSGAGLGLAIVRSLVASLEGEVTLASTVGGGTCVTVTLPRPAAATGGAEPVTEPASC